MDDLSNLPRAKADLGKAQWVEAKCTGIDPTIEERTHTFGVPYLMPCTIIFLHGVNSEGEWYEDASKQFCAGLNNRLGRSDLMPAKYVKSTKRFEVVGSNGRFRSPIIPFYWGYSVAEKSRKKLDDRPDVYTDSFGNPLRPDGTWGGGPFQNGTSTLTQFWSEKGFQKDAFGIDANRLNPIIGRKLFSCPNRLYYVHAARRLANLIKTIREDFPNEPINLVSHSQGTMVALCALFFMDEWGVRAPDTVMLNSSPWRFDNYQTDYAMAKASRHEVPREDARIKTFANAAAIMAKAKTSYQFTPMPRVACTHKPVHKHIYDDKVFARMPEDTPDWQADLGVGKVGKDGRKWWQSPLHSRDNRGALYVNFNPADRVIGVSVVEGIGWRGISTTLLSESSKPLGTNVMQRLFARSSDPLDAPAPQRNPAVGAKTNYVQPYYYEQMVKAGGSSEGKDYRGWRYLDGKDARNAWKVPPEKALGLIWALGELEYGGGKSESVYINAPLVPEPAVLGEKFDGDAIRYDGQAQEARGDQPATLESKEQQEDFAEDVYYQEREWIYVDDPRGRRIRRRMTDKEVAQRRTQEAGQQVVSPTNHSAFLRYEDATTGVSTVRQVLSYDLTVGRGYAFGDEAYWNYLLDLADWKKSDPYCKSGKLTVEKADLNTAPKGIEKDMVPMADNNNDLGRR